MAKKPKKQRTPQQKKRRRIIWFSILGLFLASLIACAIYLYPVFFNPASLFDTARGIKQDASPLNTSLLYQGEPDPTDEGPLLPEDHVNILLIGIDLEDKGYSADYHTDTMIVLSVNFKTGAVDMISLRRDTFAHIPGVYGFYKLNAAINCGGGIYARDHAGFLKVCEAAEWMLGGISIDYFYALQIPALIEIVDLIGGVDYNVDISYGPLWPGWQHLNGTDVARYVRARKNMRTGEEGDVNRVKRQKNMLIAIFSKLKNQNMLAIFPQLASTVNRGVFTNTTMQQTLALLNWARNLDEASIGMYSMDGPSFIIMDWAFCFPRQEERVALISKIYGVDVPQMTDVNARTARWLESYGLRAIKHMATADHIYTYAAEKWGQSPTPAQQRLIDELAARYTEAAQAYKLAYADPAAGTQTQKMNEAMRALRSAGEALANACDYPTPYRWSPLVDWTQDSDINEVAVDFR